MGEDLIHSRASLTDADDFAKAVTEFEAALPGFWWSVGQCAVGAHASCAVDGTWSPELIKAVFYADPLDSGFHCDKRGGSPAEALRNVMAQAITHLAANAPSPAPGD